VPAARNQRRAVGLSVTLTPTVAVIHGEADVGRAVLVQGLGELEDERVLAIKGDIHFVLRVRVAPRAACPKSCVCGQVNPAICGITVSTT
jgi:hypothetical protein